MILCFRDYFVPLLQIFVKRCERFFISGNFLLQVEVFDHRTVQTLKTFRHFRQNAYSGSLRADGQLLVAGGDEPIVQLFDVTPMKLELKRKFKGHTA